MMLKRKCLTMLLNLNQSVATSIRTDLTNVNTFSTARARALRLFLKLELQKDKGSIRILRLKLITVGIAGHKCSSVDLTIVLPCECD